MNNFKRRFLGSALPEAPAKLKRLLKTDEPSEEQQTEESTAGRQDEVTRPTDGRGARALPFKSRFAKREIN